MGMLFGGKVKSPPPPDPKISEAQQRQEERLDAREEKQMRELAAQKRARRIAGQRLLLSPERENPQMGIKEKLGG